MKSNWKRKLGAVVVLAGLVLTPLNAAYAAQVEKLRAGIAKDNIRIAVDLNKAYAPKEQIFGNRLAIKLSAKADKTERILVRDSMIRRAYLEPAEDGSRLVIIFNQKVPEHKTFLLKNPHRLVVDIPRKEIPKPPKTTTAATSFKVGEGLTYSRNKVNMGAGNVNTSVLELKPDSDFKLDFVPGYGKMIQKGILSQIAKRSGAVALVNASYFDSDIWVVGNLKIQNKFLGMEELPRTGLVIGRDGKSQVIPQLAYKGLVVTNQGEAQVTGLNRMRLADELIYFNDGYDTDTGTNQYGTEVRVRNGEVVEISKKGRMPLDAGSFVLSGNGKGAAFLNNLVVGDTVEVRHDLGNSIANAAPSVGTAGPLLVNNGRVQMTTSQEQIPGDIAWGRAPRTGVGVRSDGTVLLVVADGRSRYSVGMTLNEFAQYFLKLKANMAMNFDGGGSSEMLVRGRIMNNPSDGRERPVRVALGVFKK